jgi:hypothetical protein
MAGTLPASEQVLQRAMAISGISYAGRVLVERFPEHQAPTAVGSATLGERDSSFLLLVHRSSGLGDTVARARVAERRFEYFQASGGGIGIRMPQRNPLAVKEPAALSLDGWLAVVRRDPYRVDWRRPDGTWIKGPGLPTTRTKITDAEKAFLLKQWREEGLRRRSAADYGEFPAFYPPVSTSSVGSILLTRDGNVVIRKSRNSKAPESRYDVVDREGKLVSRLVLRVGETIVGFGERSVYLSVADEDGRPLCQDSCRMTRELFSIM